MSMTKAESLQRRHRRIRVKVKGTAERPRLCIHRTLKHLYVQVINDNLGVTLCAATTNTKAAKAEGKNFSNIAAAKKLGAVLAGSAKAKSIESVVFDRGGNRYHGVIKAFADAAREAGLKF